VTNLSAKIRGVVRSIVNLPFSPMVIMTAVRLGCLAGWFSRSSEENDGRIDRIFVSFPYTSVGDVVVMLPLLERMHEVWPSARIHVAVGKPMASIVAAVPGVERVFVFPVISHNGHFAWRLKELLITAQIVGNEFKGCVYDLAIAPRWGSDLYAVHGRYLMYMTGATRRYSYSAQVDDGALNLDCYSTQVVVGGDGESEAVRQLKLLERLGLAPDTQNAKQLTSLNQSLMRVAVRERESRSAGPMIIAGKELPTSYAVVSPGATKVTRCWPIERFAEVSRLIYVEFGLPTIIVGSPGDAPLCSDLSSRLSGIATSLAGQTSLTELISILAEARLFVGNDSGPAHLAAGLGINCVTVNPFPKDGDQRYPDASLRWRPNGPKVLVIQPEHALAPCQSGCMMNVPHCVLQLTAQEVFEALKSLMDIQDCPQEGRSLTKMSE
jgi:heptosyltransferase-3